jgi:hypothetical protein
MSYEGREHCCDANTVLTALVMLRSGLLYTPFGFSSDYTESYFIVISWRNSAPSIEGFLSMQIASSLSTNRIWISTLSLTSFRLGRLLVRLDRRTLNPIKSYRPWYILSLDWNF